MAPAFAEVTGRFEPRARFGKVNTDIEQAIAKTYQIKSIPTLIVFKDGAEFARQSGAMDLQRLLQWLNPLL